jgi:hypothetical protein
VALGVERAVDDQVPAPLHAVPALVAVHGPVAAADRGDAAGADAVELLLQFGHVAAPALRVGVAPIQEGVDEDVAEAALLRLGNDAVEVFGVRVHAARRDQAQQVQAAAFGHAGVGEPGPGRPHGEIALFQAARDADQVLVDDAAGADGQVPDLAVAHLPVGQAHVQAAGAQGGEGVVAQQRLVEPRMGADDRVADLAAGTAAVAHPVQDAEDHLRGAGVGGGGDRGFLAHGRSLAGSKLPAGTCHSSASPRAVRMTSASR